MSGKLIVAAVSWASDPGIPKIKNYEDFLIGTESQTTLEWCYTWFLATRKIYLHCNKMFRCCEITIIGLRDYPLSDRIMILPSRYPVRGNPGITKQRCLTKQLFAYVGTWRWVKWWGSWENDYFQKEARRGRQ